MDDRRRLSERAVNLGLVFNVALAGLKTAIGIMGNSRALLADGINSTSDVVYYLVVKIFFRMARKPADPEHPYGHAQLESIASLVVGSFVTTTAVALFWDSAHQTFDLLGSEAPSEGAAPIALVVAVLTVACKIGLTLVTGRLGRRTRNPAVVALAQDHLNDVFTAGAAAAGILLGRGGYEWFDPLAGALVSVLILRTGIRILRDASADLMDAVPGERFRREIEALLAAQAGVRTVEEIQAHRFGPYYVINLTIGVDGRLSVEEGDRIASRVEDAVVAAFHLVKRVYVHYHPARD